MYIPIGVRQERFYFVADKIETLLLPARQRPGDTGKSYPLNGKHEKPEEFA
jgi:hypothetical protein